MVKIKWFESGKITSPVNEDLFNRLYHDESNKYHTFIWVYGKVTADPSFKQLMDLERRWVTIDFIVWSVNHAYHSGLARGAARGTMVFGLGAAGAPGKDAGSSETCPTCEE